MEEQYRKRVQIGKLKRSDFVVFWNPNKDESIKLPANPEWEGKKLVVQWDSAGIARIDVEDQ